MLSAPSLTLGKWNCGRSVSALGAGGGGLATVGDGSKDVEATGDTGGGVADAGSGGFATGSVAGAVVTDGFATGSDSRGANTTCLQRGQRTCFPCSSDGIPIRPPQNGQGNVIGGRLMIVESLRNAPQRQHG